MKIQGLKKILPTLTVLLIGSLFARTSVLAQNVQDSTQKTSRAAASSQQLNDDLQKACQQALVELEHLRNLKKLDDNEKVALNDQIKASSDLIETYKKINQNYKDEFGKRTELDQVNDKLIDQLKGEIADLKTQRDALTKQLNRAHFWQKALFVGGLILGAGLVLAAKKN